MRFFWGGFGGLATEPSTALECRLLSGDKTSCRLPWSMLPRFIVFSITICAQIIVRPVSSRLASPCRRPHCVRAALTESVHDCQKYDFG
ncbi:hypothetical protein VDGL01_05685 [Verticillium dahliae]